MREKSPAYQRYPKQIMGDDKVLLMDWDAYGMHNWLLDISWQQEPRGTIPDDTDALRRWLRNPDEETWRRVWPQLKAAWPILDGSARRFNAGMVRCAEKQANYSSGNKGKEKYVNRPQIGTQIPRKNLEEEDVNEVGSTEKPKTLEVEFALDSFEGVDECVEKIQLAWKKPLGKVGMDACLMAFDDYARRKKMKYTEAAKAVTERTLIVADLISNWNPQYIPKLTDFMAQAQFENDYKTWERTNGKPSAYDQL